MSIGHQDHAVLEIPAGSSWSSSPDVIRSLEQLVLPEFLSRARWYPGQIPSMIKPELVGLIPFDQAGGNSTCLAVIEIGQALHPARYVLPIRAEWAWDPDDLESPSTLTELRQGDRIGLLRDVASDHEFIARLMDNLRGAVTAEASAGDWVLQFRPTSKLSKEAPSAPSRIRAIHGEQSNSTALVDQNYVVKLYRRIEPGENPEVEIGHFLTEIAGFANCPALLGDIQLVHGDERYALAIVHCFVANRGDAWKFSADRIDHYVHAIGSGSGAEAAETIRSGYVQWVGGMGRRVAEMHVALSHHEQLSEFRPEPIDTRDLDFWTGDLLARADRVFKALERRRSADNGCVLTSCVLQARDSLQNVVDELASSCIGRCKIRHHGDLHLGQMLVAENDTYIIDFEGEPSRPIAERRRKAPAARDVAGVVRSLDYSAMAALQRASQRDSALEAAINGWRDASTSAFLRSYRETAGETVLWPSDAHDAAAMLNFFLLEKAFYEVEYELSYRPSWVEVPLRGISRILGESAFRRAR